MSDGAVETAPEVDVERVDERSTAVDQRTTDSPPPLRVHDLEKHFGGITAVDGVSFEVESGSLTGLIGPNGAGKSTTFNCITGVHRADAGVVEFNGEDITGLRPYQIANRGLVRTFQIARELEEMTVLENMMLAPLNQRGESLFTSVVPKLPSFRPPSLASLPAPIREPWQRSSVRTRWAESSLLAKWDEARPPGRRDVIEEELELRERVWDTLEFFEIDHLAGEYAGNLSGGQRKLLEMARALMTDPDMVLLDEPLAGVNPSLEKKLLERIHTLRAEGYTFLLVEHDMDVIMEHCEHVIVMHQGRNLARGAPAEIKGDERVIEAYLGGEL